MGKAFPTRMHERARFTVEAAKGARPSLRFHGRIPDSMAIVWDIEQEIGSEVDFDSEEHCDIDFDPEEKTDGVREIALNTSQRPHRNFARASEFAVEAAEGADLPKQGPPCDTGPDSKVTTDQTDEEGLCQQDTRASEFAVEAAKGADLPKQGLPCDTGPDAKVIIYRAAVHKIDGEGLSH